LGPLQKCLLHDENDPNVKYWIAVAIGCIGGMRATEILFQAFKETARYAQSGIIDGMVEAMMGLNTEDQKEVCKRLLDALGTIDENGQYCIKKIIEKLKELGLCKSSPG